MSSEELIEAKRVIRVNSKGVKTRKVKCRKGYRLGSSGVSCVPATGSERSKKRRSIKKAIRTKRAAGASLKRRTTKKRLKAIKRPKSYGL